MMITPIALAAEESLSWGDRATTAGTTALLGMVTIFCVLALLWGAIELMHKLIFREKGIEKAPKTKDKTPVASSQDDAAIAAAIAASIAASEDDGAVVAAITAAISAMRAEEGHHEAFRVVSFKRVANGISRRRF